MSNPDDAIARHARVAIETAAAELKVPALALARRLNDAEIARLILLLNAALPHVDHPALRHRIEDVLMAVTDGRLPGDAETELDWALKVTGRRRADRSRRKDDEGE